MNENRRHYWIEHIEKCLNSDGSQRGYCRNNNINYITFKYWQNKLKKEKSSGSKFIQIPLNNKINNNSDITITLKNGIQIRTNSINIGTVKSLAVSLKDIG